MELSQLKSEQLEAYLDSLTPKGAEFLVRQVERDRLKGGSNFPHEVILAKARAVLQRSNAAVSGLPDAEEWFCKPFQDLLTDNALYLLGDIYLHYLDDKTRAMETYEILILDHEGSTR